MKNGPNSSSTAIEIVVVDHRGRFHDPRIGCACVLGCGDAREAQTIHTPGMPRQS